MRKEKLLISACLIGQNVKYNGGNNLIELGFIKERFQLFPFCPEVEGGLGIPRPPSEIISYKPLKVVNIDGKAVTDEFLLGAKKTLHFIQKHKIKKALLKSNSPSCSSNMVYDGSFGGKLVKGNGVTTIFLEKVGVTVIDEKEILKRSNNQKIR